MNTDKSNNRDNGSQEDRNQSPPAFLDLADSAARLGTNVPELTARVELKRLEHERQRLLQRKVFEDQMRMLEKQQEQELLSIPFDPNAAHSNGVQHLAASAPTTPPRLNGALPEDQSGVRFARGPDANVLSEAVGTAAANKRKSVTYASTVLQEREPTPPPASATATSFSRAAGAKSMPGSRRGSPTAEDIAKHLQGLSLAGDRSSRASPVPTSGPHNGQTRSRFGSEDGPYFGQGQTFNAGMMLDEQLDQEMHNAMRNLPTSDEDKFHGAFTNKMSTSSAALDLAHRSQTSPRGSFSGRAGEPREKSSEWPQYNGAPRSAEIPSRRNLSNAVFDEVSGNPIGSVSASATPAMQHPQGIHHGSPLTSTSRRGTPPVMLDSLTGQSTRSVPGTPLGFVNGSASHLNKTPGTPHSPDSAGFGSRISPQTGHSHKLGDNLSTAGDLHGALSRHASGQYDGNALSFNSIQTGIHDPHQSQYTSDSVYNLNNGLDDDYNTYGYESRGNSNPNNTSGSTALYHHNGARYGLGIGGRPNSTDKMNGLHGPKHKRGDVDREFNRFAGTRLEDLQGEIPALCKDQHGCRYLQKKLEEGLPEHRDMIFRETFGHFADLMTDPFGNYLCQKLLEYSTDEQRNVICESVAQDLVNISLNMHGTRAVQKMIDFLSARRQADLRYNTQIHSIIMALSQHVVVLIKDLNGNHVIQKCLNKLAPEDNQFIYNAVAANCVEVATHRHGCCVLQRCVDHASDQQRAQLVNEITYNALTLVQDPYGNYVVQYILDLNDSRFSDGVIRQFAGNVCALSVQKFSSNVIEKCIRVAEHSTRKMLIEELLNRTRLEKLLRDSYGNYCVQTALDYAEPAQRALLVEGIRPVLPLIRNTPYGKRIQNKLQREQMDHYSGGSSAGIGGGGYSPQSVSIGLGGPGMGMGMGVGMGMGGRSASLGAHTHLAASNHSMHPTSSLGDIYGSQGSMYGSSLGGLGGGVGLQSHGHGYLGNGAQQQNAFGASGTHLGGLPQQQSMDGYVLQGQSGPGGFTSSGPFGGFGGLPGNVNDPYQQRSSFGYGM